jgi:hypothetical protein
MMCRCLTSSSTDLDVESVDAQFLASSGDILSSQHSSVWGRLVTVCLDLHTTGNTSDGFAATGITQKVSLCTVPLSFCYTTTPYESIHGYTDLRSVTWTKVSLKDAKIRATPKTSSPK